MNGWKNKETWLVNLWLGDTLALDYDALVNITPEYIESLVVEMVEQVTWGSDHENLIIDLLNSALGEIDYRELAAHYNDDSDE
jgi:hypothetical protein